MQIFKGIALIAQYMSSSGLGAVLLEVTAGLLIVAGLIIAVMKED